MRDGCLGATRRRGSAALPETIPALVAGPAGHLWPAGHAGRCRDLARPSSRSPSSLWEKPETGPRRVGQPSLRVSAPRWSLCPARYSVARGSGPVPSSARGTPLRPLGRIIRAVARSDPQPSLRQVYGQVLPWRAIPAMVAWCARGDRAIQVSPGNASRPSLRGLPVAGVFRAVGPALPGSAPALVARAAAWPEPLCHVPALAEGQPGPGCARSNTCSRSR